jgi:EF hand domain-containing protein
MENPMQPKTFPVALVATLACVAVTSAVAQTPAPDAAGKMQDFRAKIAARFAAADANHDGKLTREEAEGKMPMVARSFDQIDKTQRGYVTQEDIQAFMRERTAQHRGGAQGATN